MPETLVLLLDLLILTGLLALGAILVRLILGHSGPLEIAAFAFPLGMGTYTWLLFLLSWAGVPLGQLSMVLAYTAALGLLGLGLRRKRAVRMDEPALNVPASLPPTTPAQWTGLAAVLLVYLAIMAPLAVGRGHSRWDAPAGWIVKGYGIALEGDIRAGETWGAWGLAYPLNIPLMAGIFRSFDGDQLPGSMLTFPLLVAGLAAGVYRFWRRQSVGGWWSLLGIVLLLTNPLILEHSSVAYANLPTAVYVVLGVCSLVEGLVERRTAAIFLGSLLLGLAGWTRSEAVGYGLFITPALLVIFRLVHGSWPAIREAVLPFSLIELSWFAFGWSSVAQSHLGGALRGVLPRIQAGEFRLFELYLIPRLLAERALDPAIWGYLFPVAGVLCLVGVRSILRRRPSLPHLATLAAAGVAAAIPVGIFYVRAFTRQRDFFDFLNRAFDRAFLPAAVLLIVLAFLLAFTPAGRPDGDLAQVALPGP